MKAIHRDRIADLRSSHGALVSLYAARPGPGGFAALLSDLGKQARAQASGLDKVVEKSVRTVVDRVRDFSAEMELGSAPGYAVFASDLEDVFVFEPLDNPPPNVAAVGPRPYMRPLRAAPRALRSAVIVADRAEVRVFSGLEGIVEELGEPIEADPGKRSYGGFSGYDEYTTRARADEVAARIWREAVDRLLERHVEKPFDYVAIGSQEETLEDIGRTLHPYLARLPRETFTSSPQAVTLAALRTEVVEMDQSVREQRQTALAGRVCDTAWSGGNAVLGLNGVIEAANAQAIDTLVVAGPFTRPGFLCNSCGLLSRTDEKCPVCERPMFASHDIVSAAMDATVEAGGSVSQIAVASPLDREGVGALVRFQVGTDS